jgi:hypothetical protein
MEFIIKTWWMENIYIEKLSDLSPRANYTDRATAAWGEVNANFYE